MFVMKGSDRKRAMEVTTPKGEGLRFYFLCSLLLAFLRPVAPSSVTKAKGPITESTFVSVPEFANATEGVDTSSVSDYSDDGENEAAEEDAQEAIQEERSSSPKKRFQQRPGIKGPKQKQSPRINMTLEIPKDVWVPRKHPFDLVLFTTAEASKVSSAL